jgi:hypothetical protein
MLTTPAARNLLASCWEALVEAARLPQRAYDPHVPVAAARVKAADDDISGLVAALRGPGPVSARGMAFAAELLQDGCGPAYNPASPKGLSAAVREAQRHLGATMVLAG